MIATIVLDALFVQAGLFALDAACTFLIRIRMARLLVLLAEIDSDSSKHDQFILWKIRRSVLGHVAFVVWVMAHWYRVIPRFLRYRTEKTREELHERREEDPASH